MSRKITLVDQGNIISDDAKIAEIMNTYFLNLFETLEIVRYNCIKDPNGSNDQVFYIVDKFKNHSSIIKIKEKFPNIAKITLTQIDETDITSCNKPAINNLNTRKPHYL